MCLIVLLQRCARLMNCLFISRPAGEFITERGEKGGPKEMEQGVGGSKPGSANELWRTGRVGGGKGKKDVKRKGKGINSEESLYL